MKDMCTLSILPDLIEAGVDSFKIEGRMKKAEYAAGVTSVYRKYIDRYFRLEGKGTGWIKRIWNFYLPCISVPRFRTVIITSRTVRI